jgi:hypothetical protein
MVQLTIAPSALAPQRQTDCLAWHIHPRKVSATRVTVDSHDRNAFTARRTHERSRSAAKGACIAEKDCRAASAEWAIADI